MTKAPQLCMIALVCSTGGMAMAADRSPWPPTLPVYDHVVIVVEENKDFEQIPGGRFDAPYIRKLATEGATFERMFAEEHVSQGNYFWLFSVQSWETLSASRLVGRSGAPSYCGTVRISD